MLSKILVGVLGVAVLSVGTYVYWQSINNTPDRPTDQPGVTGRCPSDSAAPCCQQPSRSSCLTPVADEGCCNEGCCTDLGTKSGAAEALAIPPREVK
ncbi:MAG TPA: hypothetical protein VKE40_25685 [Gemmataceae bacterium]|nr:hypothetical protein [Gemmataceae bacterium]